MLVAFTSLQEIADFWNHTMEGLEKASDVFWRTGACELWMTEARAEVQKATTFFLLIVPFEYCSAVLHEGCQFSEWHHDARSWESHWGVRC